MLTFSLTWALPDLNRERQISVGTVARGRSGARGWGLAVPTERSRLTKDEEEEKEDEEQKEEGDNSDKI